MAMLRNIRNMIKAGVSEKHHSWVLHKLSDEVGVLLFLKLWQRQIAFYNMYYIAKQVSWVLFVVCPVINCNN